MASKSSYDKRWEELIGHHTSETTTPARKRIGDKDRDAYSEHLSEAYSAGYLNDEELHARKDQVLQAKYSSDLDKAVEELPSHAELKGKEILPDKVHKWAIGSMWDNSHPVISRFLILILGLCIAIVPGVLLSGLHLTNVFPFNGVMALTILIGAGTAILGIGGLIQYGVENDCL